MDDSTNLVVELSLTDLTVRGSSRVVLHNGIDRLEMNAFTWGMTNFDACFPFVSHIAMPFCTGLQRERRKRTNQEKTGKKKQIVYVMPKGQI